MRTVTPLAAANRTYGGNAYRFLPQRRCRLKNRLNKTEGRLKKLFRRPSVLTVHKERIFSDGIKRV
ncbi:hypothetical protein [Neisseria sp.]|uniref:hypothetical protein n=1 Tax=Neisseria sp. TaxID=192066 RepID=UPI0035A056DB